MKPAIILPVANRLVTGKAIAPEELASSVDAAVRYTAALTGLAVIDAVEQPFDSFAAVPELTKMAVA